MEISFDIEFHLPKFNDCRGPVASEGIDEKMLIDVCEQYFALGTLIPYESILLLSKLIFQVPSFSSVSEISYSNIPKIEKFFKKSQLNRIECFGFYP